MPPAALSSTDLHDCYSAGRNRALTGDPSTAKGAFIHADGVLTVRQVAGLGQALVDQVDMLSVHPVTADNVDRPGGFDGISVGGSSFARMKLNFQDPFGRKYIFTAQFAPVGYAGSAFLVVSRPVTNQWIVESQGTPDDKARVMAFNQTGKLVTTDEGLYAMPFRLTVTK